MKTRFNQNSVTVTLRTLVWAIVVGNTLFSEQIFAQAKAKPGAAKALKAAVAEKAKRSEPAPAVAVPAAEEPKVATRWSKRGITLGVAGQWVIPKGYIQGAPEGVDYGKENGYSTGARISIDYNNFWRWFGVFETYDFKMKASQAGLEQKYNWGGYRTAIGLEMSGQGLGRGDHVYVGWGFGVLIGGGLYIPKTVTAELGDKTIDRSAFANSSVAFGRIGLRVFYSFSFGVNMGLAYFYDATSGKVEKPRDTGEQIKELNSHNFQVFIDARILNFGEQTYDR